MHTRIFTWLIGAIVIQTALTLQRLGAVSSQALKFMPEAQSDKKVENFPVLAGKAASVKSAETGLLHPFPA